MDHLSACNDRFCPPLSGRVDIPEYAKKISAHAVTFEAWDRGVLVGLVVAYFNDHQGRIGYITNVSVEQGHAGAGIATELIRRCLDYARHGGFREIRLEVHKDNRAAIRLYGNHGFVPEATRDDFLIMKHALRRADRHDKGEH